MNKEFIINKIGSLICDKTTGILKDKEQLLNQDECFGSMVTLTYLQKEIIPLLDKLRSVI